MPRLRTLAALAVLLLVGRYVQVHLAAKKVTRLTYRTAKVTVGDLVANVSATGTLNAVTTVQVGSQLSGIVLKLHADYNSEVKRDQLLAEIDPATFSASVAQGEADVDASKTAVQSALTDLKTLDSD